MRFILKIIFIFQLLIGAASAQDLAADLPAFQNLKQQHELIVSAALASTQGRYADAELAANRQALEELQNKIEPTLQKLQKERLSLDEEIQQFGPPPSDASSSETDEVSKRRKELVERRSLVVLALQDFSNLNDKVQESIVQVVKMRRELFTNALLIRTSLSSINFEGIYNLYSNDIKALISTSVLQSLQSKKLVWLASLICFLLLVSYPVNKRLIRKFDFFSDIGNNTFFKKVGNACLFVLLRTYAPVLGISVFLISYIRIYNANISPENIAIAIATFLAIFLAINTVRAIVHMVAASNKDISLESLSRISTPLQSLIGFMGVDYLLYLMFQRNSLVFQLEITQNLIFSSILGLHFIWFSLLILRFSDQTELVPIALKTAVKALMGAGFFILISAATGYIALAYFLSQKVVLTGIIFGALLTIFNTGQSVGHEGNLIDTALGRSLKRRLHLGDEFVDRLGYVAGLAISIFSALIAIPILLLIWSFKVEDILFWGNQFMEGISLGSVKISPFSLLEASLIFFSIVMCSQYLRSWIDRKVMIRSKADSGVTDSIKAGIRYVGIALAVVLASMSLGIDFSNLAIVAGALSIGIGFGLQNIVSNFVSGLILLIERPIKVGDWVETTSISGFVKNISVRATEVETFNQQSIIVPNSEFINSQVGNWTHKNRRGRLVIPIGVSYDSDSRAVSRLLKSVVLNEPMVLSFPEPQISFTGFGASSLDFEIKVYVADILTKAMVETELRHAVLESLKREGVEIPYTKIDVHFPEQMKAAETSNNSESDNLERQ